MRKILSLMVIVSLALPNVALAAPRAFPGAEGFGSTTRGAYAGSASPTVYKVTNTNNSGDGSFRAAAEASGPRIIVFRTGGIITHNGDVNIRNPYLTIAGQTAPGDGIVMRGGSINMSSTTGTKLQHIIIRGLRVRLMDTRVMRDQGYEPTSYGFAYLPAGGGGGTKAFYVGHPESCSTCQTTSDVIISNNSISWTNDELITTWARANNVTIAHNLMYMPSNALNHHYGPILGIGGTNISLHHNIISHARYRTPLLSGGSGAAAYLPPVKNAESINNIIYNARYWAATEVLGQTSHTGNRDQHHAFIKDFHKAGTNTVDTASNDNKVYAASKYVWNINTGVTDGSRILFDGMLSPNRTNNTFNHLRGVVGKTSVATGNRNDLNFTLSGVSELDALANYHNLIVTDGGMDGTIPRVGAYPRDIVDTIAIEEIASGSGFYGTAGAWSTGAYNPNTTSDWRNNRTRFPAYATGTMWTDSDDDGMDDAWEMATFGNLNQTAHTVASNGYTNIENYINSFFLEEGQEITYRTLTISDTSTGTGDGTISSAPTGVICGSACEASYIDGRAVTLTQTPNTGDTFLNWTGDCAGQPASGCTLTMDGNKTASAVFAGAETNFYTLTINPSSGPGTGTVYAKEIGGPTTRITCGSQGSICSYAFEVGTSVEVVAIVDSGSQWGGWIGACGLQEQQDCIVQLHDSSRATSAIFNRFSGGGEPGKAPYTTDDDMWTDYSETERAPYYPED